MNRRVSSTAGVTLLELLLVLALAGLICSSFVSGLRTGSSNDRVDRAVDQVADLDARARAFARSGRLIVLGVADRGIQLWDEDGRVIAERPLEAGIEVRLSPESVRFDRTGRTSSYVAVVSKSDKTRTLAVNGQTGWIEESAP